MIKKTMTKEEIFGVFKMVDDLNKMTDSVALFVKDKKNSFEDRLEVFLNTPQQFYTSHPWILHLPKFEKKYGDIIWFDEFCCERREVINLVDMLSDKEEAGCEEWSDEKFREFQEAVLDKCIHEFTLDW